MASSLDRQQMPPQMAGQTRHSDHPDRYDHPSHHMQHDPYQHGAPMGYASGPGYAPRAETQHPHHHRPISPPRHPHRDGRGGVGNVGPPPPGMMSSEHYDTGYRTGPGPRPPSPSWQYQQYNGPPHLPQGAYSHGPPRAEPHMAANMPMPPHMQNTGHAPPGAISDAQAKYLATSASSSRKSPKPKTSRNKEKKDGSTMGKNTSADVSVAKRTGASKVSVSNAAAMAAADASLAAAAAANGIASESKKDKKRKEVIDRIHRIHFETIESRDVLYHELYHALTSSYSTLLSDPARLRQYTLALTQLTLQRDAALRETALLHAHQLESARLAYENEKHKVDEEARLAKRGAREKLLAVVEQTKKRLQEEKEGGDVAVDPFFDGAQRTHATRKLRNKAASRRGGGGHGGGDANGADDDGEAGKSDLASVGMVSGLQELIALSGFGREDGASRSGQSGAFDLGGLGLTFGGGGDLLSGAGMGDSSYMGGSSRNLNVLGGPNGTVGGVKSSSKKKGGSKAAAAAAASAALAREASATGGADDDDSSSRLAAATAAAAAAAAAAATAALSTSSGGRLRWDAGKSLNQLTAAKDFEIESDLINIRKTNGKRARRK